jgi:hypothetical protein
MAHVFQPKAKWREVQQVVPYCRTYRWGEVQVFAGKEPAGWHLSISHPTRNPTWEEIKAARYDLCPHDITMAMILPPTDEYVNLHNFCFHLHQIADDGPLRADGGEGRE